MKSSIYFALAVFAVLFLVLFAAACPQEGRKRNDAGKKSENKIERVVTAKSLFVTATVDADVSAVRQVVTEYFVGSGKRWQKKFDNIVAHTKQAGGFPENDRLEHDSQNLSDNKPLVDYLKLPPNVRENDLFLYDVLHNFWESPDYHCDGQPAKFRTDFIVHLERTGEKGARIEIIQFQPSVLCGEVFLFERHGPGWFKNMKWVSPTVKDSEDLLGTIIDAVKEHSQSAQPAT